MSLLADFAYELDGDRIVLPEDVLVRLESSGTRRVRIRIETEAPEPALLKRRGIDDATIDRVAATQKFERDVAEIVLAGEGIAHETSLGSRLLVIGGAVRDGE